MFWLDSSLGKVTCYVSFAVAVFYNVVICWSLYFFVLSFSAILPWVDDTTGIQCPNTMMVSASLSSVASLVASCLSVFGVWCVVNLVGRPHMWLVVVLHLLCPDADGLLLFWW